jgi:succinate dehydrogenase/fumarate reductase cytochrome b subunit
MTGVTAFLFWHILLNAERESFDTLSETTPALAMLFMGICFFLTLGTYLFFRIKNGREPAPA